MTGKAEETRKETTVLDEYTLLVIKTAANEAAAAAVAAHKKECPIGTVKTELYGTVERPEIGLKHRVFSVERGNGPCYMHFSLIYNSEGTGFMQQLTILEGSLFEKYNALIDSLEKEGMTGKKLAKKRVGEMYKEVSALIEELYDRL